MKSSVAAAVSLAVGWGLVLAVSVLAQQHPLVRLVSLAQVRLKH